MSQPTIRRSLAEDFRAELLGKLAISRKQLDLSQSELAARMGCSRMTVHRAEAEGADTALSTFILMALALGLSPALASGTGDGASEAFAVAPDDIVHRGYHHNRTRHDLHWRDRQREAAFARSWEVVNEPAKVGLSPVMANMVPGHTQDQASAVATAVQWLGSEVGFDFLTRVLDAAGYTVLDRQATDDCRTAAPLRSTGHPKSPGR